MLEDILTLDEKFCDADNLESYLLNQKFGIEFMVTREGSSSDDLLTTLQEIAETQEVTRSGNPGYQFNQPLIVAEEENSLSSKKVNVLGYFMKGPSHGGECLAKNQSGGPA